MTKATIVTKREILCPTCGERHGVEHLFARAPVSFGPWYCDDLNCSTRLSGTVQPDGSIDLETSPRDMREAFHLLHGHGLWLVVRGYCEPDGSARDSTDYFYREHTCTSNVLRAVDAVWLEDGDSDPHGIFEPVAQTPITPELDEAMSNMSFDEVRAVFGLAETKR